MSALDNLTIFDSDYYRSELERFSRRWRFNRAKQAAFLRALAGPMSVGKPPIQICEHIQRYGDAVQQQLAVLILDSLREGGSICDALDGWIDSISLSALRATESAGPEVFVQSLEKVATSLEKSSQGRKKIIALSLYPSLILLATILLMIYLISPVVEQLKLMIQDKSDPTLDQLVHIVTFYREWLWLTLIGVATAIWGYHHYMANNISSFRHTLDHIPLFAGYRLNTGSRFIGTYALLKQFRLPALRIFSIMRATDSRYLQYHLTLAEDKLREGVTSEVDALDTGLLDDKHVSLLHLYASTDEEHLIEAMNKAALAIEASLERRNKMTAMLIAFLIGSWAFFNVVLIISVLFGFNPKDHMQLGV